MPNWDRTTIDFKSGVTELMAGRTFDFPRIGIDPVCIILGSVCLNDCIFCQEVRCDQIPNVDYFQVAGKLKKFAKGRKIRRLVMSGYEVLTFPNIVELAEAAKRIGFSEIEMMTSGNTLNVPKFAERLAEAGVTHYLIPLYGHNAKLHDSIVGKEGAFYNVVEGIKKAKKFGAKVFVSSLALRQNIDSLDKLEEFSRKSLGCEFIFGPVRKKINYKNVCPSLTDIGKSVKKAFPYGFPLCASCFRGRDIAEYDLKALVRKSAEEAYNYMYFVYQPIQKISGVCDKCSMADRCPGVLTDYINLFGVEKVKKELKPYG